MDNNVLAKVGNVTVTKEQMIQLIRSLPQQQAMEFSSEEGRKRLLEEMIAGEMLYLEAVEKEYDKDEEFKKILEETIHNLLQRYAVQKLLQNVTVTDNEGKEYYESHKSEFVTEEEVEARHILVDDEEKANDIYNEIQEGLDFSEAAKKYSTCPSKERGGELGAFSKGRMVPEFEAAAFSLELGEISKPVKTQFGYHIIIVDKKNEEKQKTYEEVENQIKQQLLRKKQEETYLSTIEGLKAKYSVEINEEALK